MALFIGSNIYRGSGYGPLHPLSIPRVPVVIDLCRALGWLPSDRYRNSPRAKPQALRRFHTGEYVDALLRAEASQATTKEDRDRHGLGTLSNPVFGEMYRRPATAVGGGMLAVDLVAQGGVVFNPGGGTHHAMPDRAAGFCYLNEPVLTILRLLDSGFGRVAYVDIDAHHGDGVEVAFATDPRVAVISVHEEKRWPFSGGLRDRGVGNVWNLPVPRGFHDAEFMFIINDLVAKIVVAHKPDAIFLQCGADAVAEDPLSRLSLSNNAHVAAVRALRPLAPRMIVSGGGGYNPWTVGRLWSRVWAALGGYEEPDRLPQKAQDLLRALAWNRKAEPSEALLTTLADAPREAAVRPEIRDRVSALRSRLRVTV